MAKQKFRVWQAGWEDEAHEVEADLERRECPACEFVADLPADVPAEGLDPIVVVCVGPDGVEHPRRIEFRGRGPVSQRMILSCYNATPDDIEEARGRVAEAKAKTGVREHFYTGRSSPTRLVPSPVPPPCDRPRTIQEHLAAVLSTLLPGEQKILRAFFGLDPNEKDEPA